MTTEQVAMWVRLILFDTKVEEASRLALGEMLRLRGRLPERTADRVELTGLDAADIAEFTAALDQIIKTHPHLAEVWANWRILHNN